jgi:hypothetical protein
MVVDAVATAPRVSVAVTVTVCVPACDAFGIQLKYPDELILEPRMVVPLKLSVTVYVGFEKPVATAVKVNVMFAVTDVDGETD